MAILFLTFPYTYYALCFIFRSGCDGTPERALSTWTVLAPRGTIIKATAVNPRAGTATALISLV